MGFFRRRKRRRTRFTQATRTAVFARTNGRCWICGWKINPNKPWDVHHIKPFSRGGSDDLRNLAPTHHECNIATGAKRVGRKVRPWLPRL